MALLSTLRKILSGKKHFCSAVIAAAGLSQRMDGADKLLLDIQGIPVLGHTLLAFQVSRYIDEIVIVTRSDLLEQVGEICSRFGITKAAKVIVGGARRLESVSNGLFAVSGRADLIAVHDGARPCVEVSLIDTTVEAAARLHAAAPAVRLTSTIKKVRGNEILETVDREDLVEIQTPQVFKADLIKAALTKVNKLSVDITDECKAVELLGAPVYTTEGSRCNIKITTIEDFKLAQALLGIRN